MGGLYWIRIYEVIVLVAKNFITKKKMLCLLLIHIKAAFKTFPIMSTYFKLNTCQ